MPSLVGTPILLGAFKQSWKGIHVVDVEGRAQVGEELQMLRASLHRYISSYMDALIVIHTSY